MKLAGAILKTFWPYAGLFLRDNNPLHIDDRDLVVRPCWPLQFNATAALTGSAYLALGSAAVAATRGISMPAGRVVAAWCTGTVQTAFSGAETGKLQVWRRRSGTSAILDAALDLTIDSSFAAATHFNLRVSVPAGITVAADDILQSRIVFSGTTGSPDLRNVAHGFLVELDP